MSSKLLFYGVSTHLGGAERSLLDFLKYYKTSSHPKELCVLLPKDQGPLIDELKLNNIPYETLRFPYFWLRLSQQSKFSILLFLIFGLPGYLIYLFRLYRKISSQDISAIHSTGIKCHISLCLLHFFIRAQVVVHFRDLINTPYLQKFFLLFKNKKKIAWLTSSQAISKTFPQMPTEVVYSGFSEDKYFANKNTYLHDLLKITRDQKLVGLVGVFARWKGQKEFILAANIALRQLQNTHFLLIGGQIYDTLGEKGFLNELHTLVETLGLQEKVHFVPFQKQAEVVYNSLDLIVHCSIKPEPFGRVIVEGMFCEVPMIASGAGGALEIIKDETYGLLHPPGDYQALAEQILKSLNDPDRLKKASIAAQKARRDYSLEGRFLLLKQIMERY